jgi:hypothetical protein
MIGQQEVRYLTIGYCQSGSSVVSFLRLCGKWLALAEFPIGTHVEVQIAPGRLVITPDEGAANRVREREILGLKRQIEKLEKERQAQ